MEKQIRKERFYHYKIAFIKDVLNNTEGLSGEELDECLETLELLHNLYERRNFISSKYKKLTKES